MNAISIYKSSAGSGKTFTLVKEYLKIVLVKPSEYRQTLAITFTNKATAEMKERIVSALVKLSDDKAADLRDLILSELNIPDFPIQERAQRVLESIIHDYSGFAVSTIDSFFSRMVRALAKEMQLPLKFEMEMNQEFISTQLASMLMDDIGKSEELTHWLEQFVFTKMEDSKGWNIEHEIKFIAKEIFTARQQEPASDEKTINLAFIELLKKIKYSFESRMKALGRDITRIIENENLLVTDFSFGVGGAAGYFYKIARGGLHGEEWTPGIRTKNAAESADKWVAKNSSKRDQIIQLANHQLISLASQTISFFNEHFKDYVSASEVLAVSYMAGIVHYLKEKLTQYRDENDVLMLSDTNFLLKKFISGNDTPFVYEKTGNQYKNFLIDEFQDTGDLQWENLLPLVLNGLASGGFVMLVGDAKQSIYRWRGGNLRLLLEKIHVDINTFASIKKSWSLDTNFRSLREIVEFNNLFFSLAPHLLPFTDQQLPNLAYKKEDTFQKNHEKKSSGGFVSISMIRLKKSDEVQEKIKWKHIAQERLLVIIRQNLEKGFQMQDMAIIVRTNKEGSDLASFLSSNGYNKISSAESLLLSQAPQVVFLINLLKVLAYPKDKPALAEVVYYYNRYILKKEGSDLHVWFSSISKNETQVNAFLPADWEEEKGRLVTLPIYEIIEQLVHLFKLDSQPDAYIQRFLDMMLDYSTKNRPLLKDFLQWWEDHKDSDRLSVIVPRDPEAITIISVHRSKGLQFPIVIMPFLEWDLMPKATGLLWISSAHEPYQQLTHFPVKTTKALLKSNFETDYLQEVDQNYLDNLNLLYVAFTRAEEKLFICAPQAEIEDGKISKVSHLLSRVLQDGTTWKDTFIETEDSIVLQCGEDHIKATNKKPTGDNESDFDNPSSALIQHVPFNRWQNQITVRVGGTYRSNDAEELEQLSANDFGMLIHECMSMIKNETDKDHSLALLTAKHMLSEDESKRIQDELSVVLSLTREKGWFTSAYHILNETEFALPDGSILRPDRVMISGPEVVVLDYKTGAIDVKHKEQLHSYLRGLQLMGYIEPQGFLLYLQDKKLVRVA